MFSEDEDERREHARAESERDALQRRLDEVADRHLGSLTVTLVASEETRQLAELLAQARLHYEPPPNADPATKGLHLTAHLRMPPALYRDLDEDEGEEVYWRLSALMTADGCTLWNLLVVPDDPPEDWRGQVLGAIEHQGPVNQAIVAPLPEAFPTEDRMRFRSGAERQIYKAFKRRQLAESEQKLLIAPNPAVRISDRTVEPDFLIVYQSTAGILEIDGPGHRTRYAADASKDRIFQDHGVRHVERIVPEDVTDDLAADNIVNGFLRRLLQ